MRMIAKQRIHRKVMLLQQNQNQQKVHKVLKNLTVVLREAQLKQ